MKMVFVFGSNDAGIHGAGAAKYAMQHHGAQYGKSYGHYGNSFAIPTKDEVIETLPLNRIEDYVRGFLAYAKGHRKLNFQVTAIGCGLAGYQPENIALMFFDAPSNCYFDKQWEPWLGTKVKYWGTF